MGKLGNWFVSAMVVLVAATVVEARNTQTVDFLVAVMESEELRGMPNKRADVYTCWNLSLHSRLWKLFSLLGVSTRVTSHSHSWREFNIDDYNEAMITIVDLTCPDTHELLAQAGKAMLLAYPHRWVLLEYKDDVSQFSVDLSQLPVYVDSHVLVCRGTEGGGFVVGEVFKRGRQEPLVSQDVGVWSSEGGLELYDPKTMSKPVAVRRQNLMGTKIRTTFVVTENDSYAHMTGLKNKHIDSVTKLNYALLYHVAETMNASLEATYTDSWGFSVNGTFTGLLGILQRREVDVGGSVLFITKERMAFLEYIAETSSPKGRFVFRQPPLSYVSNVFALPFNTSVWLASAVLVTLIGILLYWALKWENKRDVTPLDRELEQYLGTGVTPHATWSDVVLLSLGAVCQQGSTVEPRSVPGRLVTLVLFVAVIFLYTSYSASIVALLQSSTDSINTLYDLLHSRIELGVHDIIYSHHFLKKYAQTSTDPVRRALYRQKIAPPGQPLRFYSLKEGVERMRKGFFAFHMQTSQGYQLVADTYREEEKCGFKEIIFLQAIEPHQAIPRKNPYKELLKIAYRRILEHGLQNRAVKRYYTMKPECTTSGSNFVSVGIIDFYPALLVLAYGGFCALVVLVFEIIVKRRRCFSCFTNKVSQ